MKTLLTLLAVVLVTGAQAATFTVINTNQGGPGSFPDAIAQANASPGHDIVDFSLPPDQLVLWFTNTTAVPIIREGLTIDGTTQPGYAGKPLVHLRYQLQTRAQFLNFTNCSGALLRGLMFSKGTLAGVPAAEFFGGGGNRVVGCLFTNSATLNFKRSVNNVIGGTNAGEGNKFYVSLAIQEGSVSNKVHGNFFQTTLAISCSSDDCEIGSGTPEGANILHGIDQGILLSGSGSRIRGNYIGVFPISSGEQVANYSIELNYATNAVIGGTLPGEGNYLGIPAIIGSVGGIYFYGQSRSNRVLGNVIGLNPTNNTTYVANFGNAIRIESPYNFIGDGTPAGRNIISGARSNGVALFGTNCFGNVIAGNWIGTDLTGTTNRGNQNAGVLIANATNNTIGPNNLIVGSKSHGITIAGTNRTVANVVLGNQIGIAPSVLPGMTNAGAGLAILYSSSVAFPNNGPSNTMVLSNAISGNATGILIQSTNSRHISIRANRVWDNYGLGLDLNGNGVTSNDAGDADQGANGLQNFPVLGGATHSSTGYHIAGTLSSKPGTTYEVDFFASERCDGSGSGEGQFYLGSAQATTDGAGNATFDVTFFGATPGTNITATATDPLGNTSEFSPCVASQPGNLGDPIQLSFSFGGSGLHLEWPDADPGLRLEFTTNLVPPVVWTVISEGINQSGGKFSFDPPTLGSGGYYRLSKP